MTGLPVLSGDAAIRAFEKMGYRVVRQKGSHVRMVHPDPSKKSLTIPRHDVLGKGLLRKILRDADISSDEFAALLR